MTKPLNFSNFDFKFKPRFLARNTHYQTIASSLIKYKAPQISESAQEMILHCEDGVRLQGFYTQQPENRSKGIVLMLHGWLGHVDAAYLLAMSQQLYSRGFSIFRLHYRDHGGTHHLNPGLFRGDLLDEVFAAAQQIAALEGDGPFHIIGASLGGSFALRIAWRHSQTAIPTLEHTIAISPSINPYRTTLALDNGPHIYLAYFRRKWREHFKAKQAVFPERYKDISAVIAAPNTMTMTEAFVPFSPYASAREYLSSYAVTPEMMAQLQSNVTIIAAEDDPMIPVDDFYDFNGISPWLHTSIQQFGGHVGFVDIFPFRYWVNEVVTKIIDGELR